MPGLFSDKLLTFLPLNVSFAGKIIGGIIPILFPSFVSCTENVEHSAQFIKGPIYVRVWANCPFHVNLAYLIIFHDEYFQRAAIRCEVSLSEDEGSEES